MKANAFNLKQLKNQRLVSPPKKRALQAAPTAAAEPVDTVRISGEKTQVEAPVTYQPKWAGARTKDNEAKLTGFQKTALVLGSVAALAGTLGAAIGVSGPPSTDRPEPAVEISKEAPQQVGSQEEIDLTAPIIETQEVKQEARFEDGRELLVSRPQLVHADQFAPDPSQAIAQRGSIITYDEAYIDSLVSRNLTEVPQGQPSFTAEGVDPGQRSKLYFDSDLQPTSWGYGAVKTGNFNTRPSRMNSGMGLRDEIIQHQISAVYRLENQAEMDGVTLEPGLYRLITLEASSRVATPNMHRSVAPGHRLVPSGSGFANDFKPVQTDEAGRPLKVNPDDIVQVWTLTAEEAAEYNQ